jgi:hypothetical protein
MESIERLGSVRAKLNSGHWSEARQSLNLQMTVDLCVREGGAALVTLDGYILRPIKHGVGDSATVEWVCHHGQCRTPNCAGYETADPHLWGVYAEVQPMFLCEHHLQDRHDEI